MIFILTASLFPFNDRLKERFRRLPDVGPACLNALTDLREPYGAKYDDDHTYQYQRNTNDVPERGFHQWSEGRTGHYKI